MTTATDTGNQFADAWRANQWDGARAAANPQAVAADGKNPEVDAYRSAWAKENMGNYGDINVAPASSLLPATAAPAAASAPKFMQQNDVVNGANMTAGPYNGSGNLIGTGGYGTFKYGMPIPQAGTPEFADFQAYFANGGMDPNNHYGKQAETEVYRAAWKNPNDLSHLWTSGGNANVAGGGIGDTGANAAASASGNTAW